MLVLPVPVYFQARPQAPSHLSVGVFLLESIIKCWCMWIVRCPEFGGCNCPLFGSNKCIESRGIYSSWYIDCDLLYGRCSLLGMAMHVIILYYIGTLKHAIGTLI